MPITIQEIIASDTISQLVDKTNFNFDQLLLNGGGPAGPPGIQGPVGPAGGRGPKGSTWYEDLSSVQPGVTPLAVPPTATPLSSDYYLQLNGDVWEYLGSNPGGWVLTTVNLVGPAGPTGPPGGFGLAFGFNTLAFKNTLYNGQLGTSTTGATADNEGVPSVMIGGMGSNYTGSIPGITLTNAYLLPPAIETALQSSNASLLIHQKNSSGRSIIFHGGAADATDYYEQSVIASLSGVSIGIDDKLILDVPKAPAAPVASMFDLIGFEVNSPLRSQSYLAGQQIRFVTGDDDVSYGSFHNSNFEIQVGQGRPNSTNKFKVSTLSTGTQTLMEMGGGVTPIATQTTNPGNFQLLSGLTRFVTTTNGAATGEFGVYALGNIDLNAAVTGGNPNTKITMSARTGGITAESSGGNISIVQTDTSSSNTSNIVIENRSANLLGTGGNVNIEGNCAIILKSQTQTVYDAPSIAINLDGGGVPGTYLPHTAFIGRQTWTAAIGSFTVPLDALQYNNLEDSLLSNGDIFRQTGSTAITGLAPGVFMEKWIAGTQTLTAVDAGLLAIVQGNEGPTSPVTADYFMYDNSLGFGVRSSDNTKDYFNASSNKISFATPIVLKRVKGLNSSSNSSPASENYSYQNAGAYDKPTTKFGWNTVGQQSPSITTGMPTKTDLNVPLITLSYGAGQSIDGFSGVQGSNLGYDYTFHFPEGAYPGQKLILKVYVQAGKWVWSRNQQSNILETYGTIRILLPKYRVQIPEGNPYTSWYRPVGSNNGVNYQAGYTSLNTYTYASDMLEGDGRISTYELIWDGLEIKQYGMDTSSPSGYNRVTSKVQFGWSVLSQTADYISIGGPVTV